ncbi:MAG: four helix bundle protein [Candidatus Omnitrophica bacterium]|jgi:four helix bundle protein|nr:four helix bundle protein [Candidatus Omnitrophota bacterium]
MLHQVAKSTVSKTAPYEKLKFYQDICQIRKLTYQITENIVRSHMRLASQMRDAARSAKQNLREGYRKGTLGEFIHSIKISQGSLAELSGDMEDCLEDGIIQKTDFDIFMKLYRSADYMSNRYLISLYKIEKEGTWRTFAKRSAK